MVYRMGLTFDEIVEILDIYYFGASTIADTLLPSLSNFCDLNSMFKSLFPVEDRLNITIDAIRLRPYLTINKTKKVQ